MPAPDAPDVPTHVLLIEPDEDEGARLAELLRANGRGRIEVAHAPRVTTALPLLGDSVHDVVLVALSAGEEVLERVRAACSIPLVAIADEPDAAPALAALRRGADDCILRSECRPALLVRCLLHAVERARLHDLLDNARRHASYLTTHDPLTRLPNRFALENGLRHAIHQASQDDRRIAVLFLGLDRFRHVNDTSGHAAGDTLLTEAAERLRGAARDSDLVARVGGDEFVLVLDPVTRAQDAALAAAEIHELMTPSYHVGDREYWVTPSTGIALFPRDGAEPEALVRSAYSAMRGVKNLGGGSHAFFTSAMNDRARSRAQLESRLRRALETDELQLFYQPKVETGTGRIVGAEALLRWTDGELGVVEPKTVIPLAEETGLISAIGQWSLRTACAQNAEWQREGFGPLRMSVNLSPRQIKDDGIREAVVRALWDTGLDPGLLELEITESCLMENEEVASRLLQELKQVGVTVSLDDFGTGFSSLAFLKRFPVDILKIDQSFVRDIALDPDDAAIVGAIISIAQNLDLGVIAEGVETEEQLAFLRARGCPEMQGFLMSPAVPAKEFTGMLREQSARGL